MVYKDSSYAAHVARTAGLPTPVPDRWDTVSDELLEEYILGYERVLTHPDLNDDHKGCIVGVFNEHVKARHKKYFDIVADYYQRSERHAASQLYFTLEKMCGSSIAMADKMLEVYNTGYGWFKEYFQSYFAERGTQKHWDAMANDATTEEDIEFLTLMAKSKKRYLDKHGVTPWVPERPITKQSPDTKGGTD